MLCRGLSAGPGANDVLPCRLGVRLQNGSDPLDAVVEAEFRNSSRPGSQAPHAPPALTFGLPGKQRVKSVQGGCVLIRLVSTLPGNRKVLPMNELDPGSAGSFDNRRSEWDRTTSARV